MSDSFGTNAKRHRFGGDDIRANVRSAIESGKP
jgi:hypothetical protein